MFGFGGMKTRGGDLDSDIDQNRIKARFWDVLQQVKSPGKPCQSNENGGEQSVTNLAPHFLVGRVTDVRCRLDDPTKNPGHQTGNCLGEQNRSGVIFIPDACGTLGAVDAAYDGRQSKWQDDRQPVQGRT